MEEFTPKKDKKRKSHVLGSDEDDTNYRPFADPLKKNKKKRKSHALGDEDVADAQVNRGGKQSSTRGYRTKRDRQKLKGEKREREATGLTAEDSIIAGAASDVEMNNDIGTQVDELIRSYGGDSQVNSDGGDDVDGKAHIGKDGKKKKKKKKDRELHEQRELLESQAMDLDASDVELDEAETKKNPKKKSKKEKNALRES
jgi:hypothetical protein